MCATRSPRAGWPISPPASLRRNRSATSRRSNPHLEGMKRMADPTYRDLKILGTHAPLPASPEAAVLERVPNPHPGDIYLVRFTAPEFTTLCPVTGQPDFAHLVIDYVPEGFLVESKSLK